MRMLVQYFMAAPIACSFSAQTYAQEPVQPHTPTRTESADRLKFKAPLPNLPSREKLYRSNGELRVKIIVAHNGSVQKVSMAEDSNNLYIIFRNYIEDLKFESTSKIDAGPWEIDLWLFSRCLTPNPNMKNFKHQFSIAILNVSNIAPKSM